MSATMNSSPAPIATNAEPLLPARASLKRPAPSLLPALEFSSSPMFPRPAKRQARSSPSQREAAYTRYPTPIPTSTTGIQSSSPPRSQGRPGLARTQSSISQRGPLSAVPSVTVPENGEVLRMGRSRNSSDYQLSANRLISRVHVEARYVGADVPRKANTVVVKCVGWNGLKLHCEGQTWNLNKHDSFTSVTEGAAIMIDVQDARVMIAWPGRGNDGGQTDSSWDDGDSPIRRPSAPRLASSPLRRTQRIASPVSPTPAGPAQSSISLSDLFSDPVEIKVFEDAPSPEHEPSEVAGESFVSTVAATSFAAPLETQSSELSEPEDELSELEDNDPDEENDPIVHSFGPFGADISSRMASFTAAGSPVAARKEREASAPADVRSSSESTDEADAIPIVNHVVNQLAFSRLSSTPLSVIMSHLPADLKGSTPEYPENKGLTMEDLRKMLNAASCIGTISRSGKDAAGKALESEYYYVPDEDADVQRRAAVVDGLRKPSLRECRKQHKQYYWKKPKTP